MGKKNRILLIVSILLVFAFCGCTDSIDEEIGETDLEEVANSDIKEENGYFDIATNEIGVPIFGGILINGEEYGLEDIYETSKENPVFYTIELDVKDIGDELVVVLPMLNLLSTWSFNEKEGLYLTEYMLEKLPIVDREDSDSDSNSSIQIYRFKLRDGYTHHKVYFKWAHFDEYAKDYSDIKADYELCIDVH